MNRFSVIIVISLIIDFSVIVSIILWWCLVVFIWWVLNSVVNSVISSVMYNVGLVKKLVGLMLLVSICRFIVIVLY